MLNQFRWATQERWQRLAWVVWTVILAASCGRVLLMERAPQHRGIYETVYAAAGRHWLNGDKLYPAGFRWESFPYGPLTAGCLAPFAALPEAVGSACYRCGCIALFLVALSVWSRAASPVRLNGTERALLLLLVLPLAGPTMVNGQIGAVVVSLILLALSAAAQGRWNCASLCAALACAIKVYPLAVVLLLAVCYPRHAGRLLLALVGVGLLPFLLQDPRYVADQYADWFHLLRQWMSQLRGDSAHNQPLTMCNCNLLLLCRVWLRPLDIRVYQVVQIVAAGVCAGLCVAGRLAAWNHRRLLATLLALAGVWMTLLGSAVEPFTYILLGPSLALMLVETRQRPSSLAKRVLLTASWTLFLLATLAVWTPHASRVHGLGPHPFAATLFLGCLLAEQRSLWTRIFVSGRCHAPLTFLSRGVVTPRSPMSRGVVTRPPGASDKLPRAA